MNFIVSSQTFLKKLQSIAGIINSNPTMIIADYFKIDVVGTNMEITATDIDTVMKSNLEVVKSEVDGSFCIPSKILLEYLKSTSEQPINFTIDEDINITISSDQGKYKLKGERSDQFPKMLSINDSFQVNIPGHILEYGISNTSFATSTDENKGNMAGIFFEQKEDTVNFVATDMHRLVKYGYQNSESIKEPKGVIIPKKPLIQLKNVLPQDNSTVTIEFNEQFFAVKSVEFEMVTRLIDGKYPDYTIAIPLSQPYSLEINKSEFEAAIRRVNIFANKATNLIRISISKNNIVLSAEDLDYANQGSETVNCSYDGDDMKLSFNAKSLFEMIHNLPNGDIKMSFSTPVKAVVFSPVQIADNESLLMLMMPLMMDYE